MLTRLIDAQQEYADREFVKVVSHMVELDRIADSIVGVYDGWND